MVFSPEENVPGLLLLLKIKHGQVHKVSPPAFPCGKSC